MATTTRSDIPGYDVVRLIDELRNPVYEVRRMPSEDIFVAKVIGDEFEPHLPAQRGKLARRLSRIVGTTIGWVRIDDHGTTPDGQTFVVSPLFERGSLAERLDGDPTPWADAVRWIAGASLSIGNLHAEGIALGRVRPSSILLSDDDEALVAIYGMASRRFDDGTFRYEAPEVVDGEEPGGPSDTYSLALILTTLVIGRTPVFGESLDEFVAGLEDICPEPVRAVITRSLDTDPEARHATGADFAHSLSGTAEEAVATEFAGATVTTHFDDDELARYRIEPRATHVPPPPLLNEDVTAHPVPRDEEPGPLLDIFDMASVTAPLDPSMVASSQTSSSDESPPLTETVIEHDTTSEDDLVASTVDEDGISAADALAELDLLISDATDNPFDVEAGDSRPNAPSPTASSAELDAAPKSLDGEDGVSVGVQTPTHEQPLSKEPTHSADGVPFIATPASRLKPPPSRPDPMQAVAVRVENFWYANRRSVASALTALAVGAIGAVAVVLAFRSYQDGQTAASEGAPPPTTEAVIMANLNNDVVFITEPPQTNTTTTTAPPRRRTTTTAASTTTATTAKPADDKKTDGGNNSGNDRDNDEEEEDDDEAPPTTGENARSSSVVTVTIPADVDEENGNRRGRGRNP